MRSGAPMHPSDDVCDYHLDSIGWDDCSVSYYERGGNPNGCAVARGKDGMAEITLRHLADYEVVRQLAEGMPRATFVEILEASDFMIEVRAYAVVLQMEGREWALGGFRTSERLADHFYGKGRHCEQGVGCPASTTTDPTST